MLRLLGFGLPNKLIAHRLSLKEGTVKVHMRNVMKKLQVREPDPSRPVREPSFRR